MVAVSKKVLIALVVLLAAQGSLADTLTLTNGMVLEGRIVKRGAESVTFEIHAYGATAVRKFSLAEIESIVEAPLSQPGPEDAQALAPTAKYDGPTYFVIPIKGPIGEGLEVNSELLRKCLSLARSAGPTAVILDVESPGGSVQELTKMLKVLHEYKDLRLVAYVRQAASAAALLSTACPEIIMAPTGSIGGAVVYKIGKKGTPQKISAKFDSLWRAQFRASAESAGHNPLLIEGMMRTGDKLSVVEDQGKPKVVKGPGDRVLKEPKEILTLTGSEAVSCGLALGTAYSIAETHSLLGIDSWRQSRRSAMGLVKHWQSSLARAEQAYVRSFKDAVDQYGKAEGYLAKEMAGPCIACLGKVADGIDKVWQIAQEHPALVLDGRFHTAQERDVLERMAKSLTKMRKQAAKLIPPPPPTIKVMPGRP